MIHSHVDMLVHMYFIILYNDEKSKRTAVLENVVMNTGLTDWSSSTQCFESILDGDRDGGRSDPRRSLLKRRGCRAIYDKSVPQRIETRYQNMRGEGYSRRTDSASHTHTSGCM